MKDEEIIKALEEKKSFIDSEFERKGIPINFMMIVIDAIIIDETLELIKRLQEENKQLKKERQQNEI